MAFTLKNIPQPTMLKQAVSIGIVYGEGEQLNIGCIALSIVRVLHLPQYPDIECIYASAIQEKKENDFWETMLWLVPLRYITSIRIGFAEPGAKFLAPLKQMYIWQDKPAPKNQMPEDKFKE